MLADAQRHLDAAPRSIGDTGIMFVGSDRRIAITSHRKGRHGKCDPAHLSMLRKHKLGQAIDERMRAAPLSCPLVAIVSHQVDVIVSG